jgi:TP901 family phage tail tape measure protein
LDKQRYDIMIGMQAGELAKGVQSAKGNLKDLRQAFKDTLDVLNTAPPAQIGVTKQLEAARKKVAQLAAEIKKLEDAGKKRIQDATPKQRATIGAGATESQGLIRAAQPSVIEAKQLKQQAAGLAELQNKSITLRYALYDVGSAAQNASQALLGYASAVLTAQIQQQRAFSNIEKTLIGEASTDELNALKNELLELATVIPVSFTELTKIGMLGAQLGIASSDIAKFTEVVAKFSAITGMSVEESAMGFGKIANILGLASDQYQALGAAIAGVGVKTAATEQQIISTSGQIGAVAKAAGFSASEVIGLSAAFASLRIAPEEARGVVVRTFNEISQAVLSFNKNSGIGGEKLKSFASIAGVTSKEFAEGWGDKTEGGASRVFQQFIRGLSTRNISQELKRLSLDGVRTSKGLTALAEDVDSVFGPGGAIAIARQAGLEGTFLDESFATIAEDLASKLEMLKNSFENLLAAGASDQSFLDMLGFIIDSITNFNKALTNVVNNQTGVGTFVQLTLIVAGLAGVLLSLVSVIAIAGGGFLALRTAYAAASASGIIFKGSILGLIGQMMGLNVQSRATAAGIAGIGAASGGAAIGVTGLSTSMRVLKYALVSTGIAALVVVLGELAAVLMESADAAEEPVTGLDEVQQGLKAVREEANATTQELVDFINQALLPMSNLLKVENSLYSLGKALQDGKNDFSQYSVTGRANLSALQNTIEAYTLAAQGDQQVLADNLTALMNYMIGAGIGAAEAFAMIQIAIGETGKTAQDVVIDFASLIGGINGVSSSAGRAQTALEKMTEAFEKAFAKMDVRIAFEGALDDFGKALADNGKKINSFSKDGRANFTALRSVIFSLKDRLANNPQSLANSLASLRVAMVKMGITSKLAFKMVDIAIDTTGKKGRALKNVVDGLVQSLTESATNDQPLRTLTDYVNDLSNVLDDALNNRYAKQDSSDSISSAWITIKEAAEDAKKAIDDANASINEMQADRNVLQYQLQVAIRYGDTLRAESIKAKLAKLDADLVEKRQDLADAQAESNKSLVGNTKYAIANRAVVRDLVEEYNQYLTTLAQSGMSSDDLKTEAGKLADEFLAQGTEMGFAKEELLKYTDAFKKDFTTVVNNVPKDITLNVVTDPALQAVIDFVKGTNAELAKIISGTVSVTTPTGVPISGPSVSGPSGPVGSAPTPAPGTRAPAPAPKDSKAMAADKAKLDTLKTQIKSLQMNMMDQENKLAAAEYVFYNIKSNQANLDKVNGIKRTISEISKSISMVTSDSNKLQQKISVGGYANGGLISGSGSGTSDSIPALVSNGEYVLRANAVKYYGADFMNSLNQMQVQRPGAATGSNVVYLSPDDRALLRAAIDRPISLYTENTRIAESANSGNVVLAQRGMK